MQVHYLNYILSKKSIGSKFILIIVLLFIFLYLIIIVVHY